MEENKNDLQPSYEELANNFIVLRKNYFEVFNRLQEYEKSNYFTQLSLLIEIVKTSDKFPAEFVGRCVNEIISMMTPVEPQEENNNEQEG